MENRLIDFKKALDDFEYLVNLDLDALALTMDAKLLDAIKNGMAQKFEYSIELSWKLIKLYLLKNDGLDTKSPKQSVKSFYLTGYIDEPAYLNLISMVDDRNKLSHIYSEEEFNQIILRFRDYLNTLQSVMKVIES